MTISNSTDSVYDVVIVGSGVAGLMAARTLLSLQPDARVLIVDAGHPVERRTRDSTIESGGYGGAGFFWGGRLYLGPGAIPMQPVGTLPNEWRTIIEGEDYKARAYAVNAFFDESGASAPMRSAPDERITAAIARAAEVGIEYVTSYPARFLSIPERESVLRRLREDFEKTGIAFVFETPVTRVVREDAGFRLTLSPHSGEPEYAVRARVVLLAPGRYGAEWLVETSRSLDLRFVRLPAAFGVRIEVPAETYAPLTSINPDPRLQRTLEHDAIIKTYSTCAGGEVMPVYRYGRTVASGNPLLAGPRRPSTNMAILAQPGVQGAADVWRGGDEIADAVNARFGGRLAVQRLADVRAERATTAEVIASGGVVPTYPAAVPGAFHDLYPAAYWDAFEDFVARIAQLAPGMETGDALLYAPADERFWYFPTDEYLQSSVPGVFVAGDGAGQSQGAIQAAVAGARAGEGMARSLASR